MACHNYLLLCLINNHLYTLVIVPHIIEYVYVSLKAMLEVMVTYPLQDDNLNIQYYELNYMCM